MANLLADPNRWGDALGDIPPSIWDGTQYIAGPGGATGSIELNIIDSTPVEAGDTYSGTASWGDSEVPMYLNFCFPNGEGTIVFESIEIGDKTEFSVAAEPDDAESGVYIVASIFPDGTYGSNFYGPLTISFPEPPPATVSYNCDCDDENIARTLADLRADLMRRLGFGAQVDNPPPGMTELLNSFLVESQELLYRRYNVLRTLRMYTWPLVEGVRMYDLPANAEECTKKLDPRSVNWVGAVRDGIWYPLRCGIPPELYSHDIQGYPERYEIRQCIEIWPPPESSDGYIAIKGHFGLEAFADDGDKVTIDDRAVFLLALANAKAHYRQPDAANYVQQLEVYIENLVAGSHHTRRYIPGEPGRADYVYVAPKPTVPFGS